MWKGVFNSFRFFEGALLIVGAVGFLTFWARTRFWLPKYIHVLAAIGPHCWCVDCVGIARRRSDQTTRVDCSRIVGARPPSNDPRLLCSPRWAACGVQPLFNKICLMPIL